MKEKVLMAMSGGVDSSVTALLLKEAGYDVVGVTMCLGIATQGKRAKCCGYEAIEDAKSVCRKLGIPHYVFDFSSELEKHVIGYFIDEYRRGRTINPCIECNSQLKFSLLLNKALVWGFDFLATGHYAVAEKRGDQYFLKKPKDKRNDQTYFLYLIPYEKLSHILFPSACLTKEEVKDIAKKNSLPVAEKKESQDLCFVPNKRYQDFLRERGLKSELGPIVSREGETLGTHRGIIFFTVGQRGGLGVSHSQPLYVVSIEAHQNKVVIGRKKDLMAKGLRVNNINMLIPTWPTEVSAKIRYRKREAPCIVVPDNNGLLVTFLEEQDAITPGQAVVFYSNDCLLGGGTIEEVLRGHN